MRLLRAQVNLRERQGFIIHPFTVPISTSAAQLSLEKDGYLIEPAFDFHQRAGYLSVAKNHENKYNLRGSYAFREVRPRCCFPRASAKVLADAPLMQTSGLCFAALQLTALFEVGYKYNNDDRNPLLRVSPVGLPRPCSLSLLARSWANNCALC
jgi:hypothetical protein